MATYLGTFPFPSLAPGILTREAMIKVVSLLTDRYGKVLKRGKKDLIKLVFRSLAVVDRKSTTAARKAEEEKENEKSKLEKSLVEQKPDDMTQNETAVAEVRSQLAGFAVDEPADDAGGSDGEDDDDLALAALDSLDAIEVFKQEQQIVREKRMSHAQIPREHLRTFLRLLLVLAPLGPMDNVADYGKKNLDGARLGAYDQDVEALVAAFDPQGTGSGIRYQAFARAIASLPFLLDPLHALFEHFLFSRNLDLSGTRGRTMSNPVTASPTKLDAISASGSGDQDSGSPTSILTPALAAHLSTFLATKSGPSGRTVNLHRSGTQFYPIYATSRQGTSMSSFSRYVMSWKSAALMLVRGTPLQASSSGAAAAARSNTGKSFVIGAFLPTCWSEAGDDASASPSSSSKSSSDQPPSLFLLSPFHALFPLNPYNRQTSSSTSTVHFHPKAGISLGCIIPPSSRTATASRQPILGPVSLRIDPDMATATFQHDSAQGAGAFLPDPNFELAQQQPGRGDHSRNDNNNSSRCSKTIELDLEELEVWGMIHPSRSSTGNNNDGVNHNSQNNQPSSASDKSMETGDGTGAQSESKSEIERHRQRMAWEEADAARRAAVNFGGNDREGARHLLEMAGIIGGDDGGGRSGGSV